MCAPPFSTIIPRLGLPTHSLAHPSFPSHRHDPPNCLRRPPTLIPFASSLLLHLSFSISRETCVQVPRYTFPRNGNCSVSQIMPSSRAARIIIRACYARARTFRRTFQSAVSRCAFQPRPEISRYSIFLPVGERRTSNHAIRYLEKDRYFGKMSVLSKLSPLVCVCVCVFDRVRRMRASIFLKNSIA